MKRKRTAKTVEEPEVVGQGSSTRKTSSFAKGRVARGAATFASNYAVKQATDRIDGLKTRMMWVVALYTVGIFLGVIALISLIGFALFAVLPDVLAGVILGIIIAPIVFAVYFGYRTIRSIIKHPLAKEYKKTIFDTKR